MRVSIRPYGENELEIDAACFKSRVAAEKFAKDLLAAAKIVWPEKAPPK